MSLAHHLIELHIVTSNTTFRIGPVVPRGLKVVHHLGGDILSELKAACTRTTDCCIARHCKSLSAA